MFLTTSSVLREQVAVEIYNKLLLNSKYERTMKTSWRVDVDEDLQRTT